MATRKKQPNTDTTIHYDEFHPDPRVAARYADVQASFTAEKHLREDHKRAVVKLDGGGLNASERAATVRERDRLSREIARVGRERKDIEARAEEASRG